MWPVSAQFTDELKKPVHSIVAKVEFLDTDFNPVSEINNYSPDSVLIDGTVDVDVSRGTRRTLTMSVLNPEGNYTPDGSVWSANADWDGFFYVNRLIRLSRGVKYEDGSTELAPIGTFMVDKADALVERGMSSVVITGSDLWKKFTKSQFGAPTTFTSGTTLNSMITTIATAAGVTRLNLDPLLGRTSASNSLQRDYSFEEDETRSDALLKVCGDYGLEVFFDPMGVLVTREFSNPFDRATVWYYDEADDLAFFIRSTIDDDRLYNHVVVVGTAKANDGGVIYRAELSDTDPASPTNITRIGDRVFRYSSSVLGSQEAVNKSVYTIFYSHFLLSNSVSMDAICNPALEGNDVVWVAENKFLSMDTRFLLDRFSIPLITTKQKLSMKRVLDIRPS